MQARTKFISVCVKHPRVKCELYGMRNAKEERGNWWEMKEGEEKDDETIESGPVGNGTRGRRELWGEEGLKEPQCTQCIYEIVKE